MASDERQEAVDDVLREWRDMVCYVPREKPVHPLNHGTVMHNLDRIEAALKRERASFDCECAGIAELAAKEEAARHSPVGNAAALRDAVIKALTLLNVCDWPSGVSLDGVGEVMREIDSALDKPPRNCDIYPKRDDAGEAWNKTLDERTRDMVQRYPLTAMDMFIDWLLAYAEPDARGDLCHED